MPTTADAFVEWIVEECEQRHWSWNYASERAGLARGAISSYVNHAKRPGLKAALAFSRLFNKPPEFALYLAGHLPKRPADSDKSPRVANIEYRLGRLGHEIREQYLPIINAVLEAAEATEGETKREEGDNETLSPSQILSENGPEYHQVQEKGQEKAGDHSSHEASEGTQEH